MMYVTCLWCGDVVQSARVDAAFCSPSCRASANRYTRRKVGAAATTGRGKSELRLRLEVLRKRRAENYLRPSREHDNGRGSK